MSRKIKYPKLIDIFPKGIPSSYVYKEYKPWLKIYGLNESDGTKICSITGAKYKPTGNNSKSTVNYFCVMRDEISGIEYIYQNNGKSSYLKSILDKEHFTYEKFISTEFKEKRINNWSIIRMWNFPEYKTGIKCKICGRMFKPSNGGKVYICGYDDVILTDKNGITHEITHGSKHFDRAIKAINEGYISHKTFCKDMCYSWNDESNHNEEWLERQKIIIKKVHEYNKKIYQKDSNGNYLDNSEKAIRQRKLVKTNANKNSDKYRQTDKFKKRIRSKENLENLNRNKDFSPNKIANLIENSNINKIDYFKLKEIVEDWNNSSQEDIEKLINIANHYNIPTNYQEYFYSKFLNIINFKSVNLLVNDFNKFKNIPGVWSVWNEDKTVCLDVAQTKNIGFEMKRYLRRLNFNKDLSDEDIDKMNNKYNSKMNRYKYRNIMKDTNKVNFIIIVIDINSKIEREMIEAQYAHDNRARYWSPAPGQNIDF